MFGYRLGYGRLQRLGYARVRHRRGAATAMSRLLGFFRVHPGSDHCRSIAAVITYAPSKP